MSWLIFAIIGYFLYAVVTISNKFLLHQKATTKPLVFSFWVGLFSIFTFVLAPFGLHWPGWGPFAFDILVGIIYFVSLIAYYWALDVNEASRAASIVGGLTPILVLVMAFAFLGDKLTWLQLAAFFLLVGGGFLISLKIKEGNLKEGMKGIKFIILTILLGAVYWVLAKFAYQNQGFITGFVWTRMGLVAGCLFVIDHLHLGNARPTVQRNMRQVDTRFFPFPGLGQIALGNFCEPTFTDNSRFPFSQIIIHCPGGSMPVGYSLNDGTGSENHVAAGKNTGRCGR